ncbi:Ternary complex factor MIP1, leucine-zipper [Quillaja saponaria]|uniref:Ternary complex factor MIP1, leucine-zipper n=1 Tax=Quillaja saponaria TaxID=32244 RepID=A0AAD7KRL9_QUISA|nr:Ternary complex factor MIP1, leucine-zipper [Quillaja saponaria]
MGFEGVGENKMLGLRFTSKHKRSKSLPDKKRVEEDNPAKHLAASDCIGLGMGHTEDCAKTKKEQSPTSEVQGSLKQEILQLEERLQNQFEVRCVLEKALGFRSSSLVNSDDTIMPKPATELIKEIAVLELEVVYLEQHLLSLYRKAFDQQSSVSLSTKEKRVKSHVTTPRARFIEVSKPTITSEIGYSAVRSVGQELDTPWKESNGSGAEEMLLDSGVHRCHSSLSQRSAFTARTSPPAESLDKALRACHSQPLSMLEYAQNASSNIISLAEHLGTRVSDHVPETPNRLSEDMVKCMSAIYCKLADPPVTHPGLSSPSSSMSSMSGFSPQDQGDIWSPGFRNNSSFDVRLDNPFHVEGLKEFSGPYSTMVEVAWICRDSQKLGDIEDMLQNFRSLISRLEEIDPRKLKHEEKLAFWINLHNSLVMHAFLAYGIPQNNVKRVFLLLKAAYNVGGHTISADKIQSTILGCCMSRPRQWLRLLLSPKTKFKTGDERRAFAIEQSEPLLHFALCTGNHSDPAIRVYTPKRVFQELEVAKEEYIRATFGVRKDQRILLPKVVESFAKDSGLCPDGLMEMIQQSLPKSLKKSIKKCQLDKPHKSIEWIPHNFTFRYLISKDMVK